MSIILEIVYIEEVDLTSKDVTHAKFWQNTWLCAVCIRLRHKTAEAPKMVRPRRLQKIILYESTGTLFWAAYQ
jgi:hypothetical protein